MSAGSLTAAQGRHPPAQRSGRGLTPEEAILSVVAKTVAAAEGAGVAPGSPGALFELGLKQAPFEGFGLDRARTAPRAALERTGTAGSRPAGGAADG